MSNNEIREAIKAKTDEVGCYCVLILFTTFALFITNLLTSNHRFSMLEKYLKIEEGSGKYIPKEEK